MPNAGARAATAWPIRPNPTMPSCLPRRSEPSMKSSANPFHSPAAHQPVALDDPAHDAEDQRPRQVGGGLGEHVRRVGDDDAALARGGDVDVVVADGDRGRRPSDRGPASSTARSIASVTTETSPCLPATRAISSSCGRSPRLWTIDVAGVLEPREHRRREFVG